MAISVSADDVRGVLSVPDAANSEDPDAVSDTDLQMEIRMAESVVNAELEPYSDDTEALELTGAILAAAYHHEQGALSSISEGEGEVSFTTTDAMTYWRQAKQLDPTGRLVAIDDGATFGFETV